MSVDDRLRRGLNEVPPADPSGVYERVVEKRVHRRIIRRLGTGLLSVAVVLGSAAGFIGLVRTFGAGPSPGTAVTEKQSASPSESSTVGEDVGLGFNLCDVYTLKHVDFLGDGADGTAWTGAPLDGDRCPRAAEDRYVVAVDYTGDGVADDVWGALEYCFMCEPYAAIDLDGDGDDELAVLSSGGTTPRYDFFDVRSTDAGLRVRPILVAPPGDAPAGFGAGEIAGWSPGGDEGYSGKVACEGFPEHPVLVAGWSWAPVDGPGSETEEVHLVRFVIADGRARVLGSQDSTQPRENDLPYPFGSDDKACGVDWSP